MAEVWKPYQKSVVQHWIDALLDRKELMEELTDWEYDFILSIKQQLRYKESLTKQQQDTLENIYANKTK